MHVARPGVSAGVAQSNVGWGCSAPCKHRLASRAAHRRQDRTVSPLPRMASQGLPAKGLADGDAVGAIARGLVREYLLRKGMTQALATFDKEAVRVSAKIAAVACSFALGSGWISGAPWRLDLAWSGWRTRRASC